MSPVHRLFFSLIAALALASSLVGGASAQQVNGLAGAGPEHVVFVQSNDPAANQVLAYHRASDGTLTLAATYDTGGKGGRIEGSMADPLASQGSLIYDPLHRLLIGVNAGSDSIYAFQVTGDQLSNRTVVPSGGSFPVSLAVHDDLVYALNALGTGSVQGFRIRSAQLLSIQGSNRSLGLIPPSGPMSFVMTPGQVGFTPNGDQLVVTTKANTNGNTIDVFGVREGGQLTSTPVVNPSATPVPFAFTFDPLGRLVVGEAGTSSVSTYRLDRNGTATPIASVSDGQVALCWIQRVNGTYFVSDAGSGSVSAFRISANGHPTVIATTVIGSGAGSGPIDQVSSRGGAFAYVQLGGDHAVAELRINTDGSLTSIGTIGGGPDMEGIVAF